MNKSASQPARVNIELSSAQFNAEKRPELPFKLLVLADFSPEERPVSLKMKPRIPIRFQQFDEALRQLSPFLQFEVPNCLAVHPSHLEIALRFKTMKDFHPDQFLQQIPKAREWLALRNLFRSLRGVLRHHPHLKKAMAENLIDPHSRLHLASEFQHLSKRVS